jgi:hypothetical protein
VPDLERKPQRIWFDAVNHMLHGVPPEPEGGFTASLLFTGQTKGGGGGGGNGGERAAAPQEGGCVPSSWVRSIVVGDRSLGELGPCGGSSGPRGHDSVAVRSGVELQRSCQRARRPLLQQRGARASAAVPAARHCRVGASRAA